MRRTHLPGVSYSSIIAIFLDAAWDSEEAGNLPSCHVAGTICTLFYLRELNMPKISRSPWRTCFSSVRFGGGTANGKGDCFRLTSARNCCRAPAIVNP